MATLLVVTQSLSGMLYPGVELARRVVKAGHRLTYASYGEAAETVEGQGIDFQPLEPSRYDAFLADDRKTSPVERLRRLRSRRQRAKESLALDSLMQMILRVDPDLILIDGEMHEHIIGASASDVPIVLLNSFVSIWRRPGLPPPHRLARPGNGWQGTSVGIWLLWQGLRFKKWHRAGSQYMQRLGCDRLSLLRQLALDHDFDFRRETDDRQWLMPFTYRRLPVLSLHAEEFEFPHRPPEHVHYVGPLLLESRHDSRTTDALRSELDALFARRLSGQRRLIYAGFGSFFTTDLDILHRLFDAVAQQRDWDLVISLGGRYEPKDLGHLPDNVHVFSWLPQPEVLRHTDVAVTHGGINTIDECVLCAVPMLIYCGFETDMAGNTSRVVHHGIGLAGDRQRDSPDAIGKQIERLMTEPSFRTNIERLQTHYAAYTDDAVAVRTVESLLAGRTT